MRDVRTNVWIHFVGMIYKSDVRPPTFDHLAFAKMDQRRRRRARRRRRETHRPILVQYQFNKRAKVRFHAEQRPRGHFG